MTAPPTPAEVRLAQRLRQLREEARLTQAALAAAFAEEQPVGPAAISSWENARRPSPPPEWRLEPYARFFATARSWQDHPRLIPADEMTAEEMRRKRELEAELLHLWHGARGPQTHLVTASARYWFFDDAGPLTVICPDAPPEAAGPLAAPTDPNYTQLHAYGDLDALIELHGHIRAENAPTYGVFFKLASQVRADDLSGHVVLLGGIAWNDITKRLSNYLTQLPVRQIVDEKVKTGEVFSVGTGTGERRFYPVWAPGDETELTEDVAFLARIPNPFNVSRTLTICNGIHSRGVLGAVRALTDARVRESNADYLAQRFPGGEFALLLRVPVVQGEAISPVIQNDHTRLYEWPSEQDAGSSRIE